MAAELPPAGRARGNDAPSPGARRVRDRFNFDRHPTEAEMRGWYRSDGAGHTQAIDTIADRLEAKCRRVGEGSGRVVPPAGAMRRPRRPSLVERDVERMIRRPTAGVVDEHHRIRARGTPAARDLRSNL
jgi:hypothetical protein